MREFCSLTVYPTRHIPDRPNHALCSIRSAVSMLASLDQLDELLLQSMRTLSLALCLVVCGCASPHRSATTRHEKRTYEGRPDGLKCLEVWTDTEKGGGLFFLTDPQVAVLTAVHTNQTALGGGSSFSGGPMSLSVDPQTGAIIGATGTAVGNVIGAAVKTAVKP